jgi:hypothetical protein
MRHKFAGLRLYFAFGGTALAGSMAMYNLWSLFTVRLCIIYHLYECIHV